MDPNRKEPFTEQDLFSYLEGLPAEWQYDAENSSRLVLDDETKRNPNRPPLLVGFMHELDTPDFTRHFKVIADMCKILYRSQS